MNLQAVAERLAINLATVSGLQAHDTIPPHVNPPAAVVMLGGGSYTEAAGAESQANFTVLLLAARADETLAQRDLMAYCAPTGTYSIKAAIESDPDLNSEADDLAVTGWGEPQTISVGEVDYIGIEFPVVVYG